MTDIEITRDGELMVAQVEGLTEPGVEFIDGYIPERDGAHYSVIDSGRVLFSYADLDDFIAEARKRGLGVE